MLLRESSYKFKFHSIAKDKTQPSKTKPKTETPRSYFGKITNQQYIDKVHINRRFVYMGTSEPKDNKNSSSIETVKVIKLFKMEKIESSGKVSSFSLIKSRRLEDWTQYFFDEVTALTRIFCFCGQGDKTCLPLKVYNGNLDLISAVKIFDISWVGQCLAIDEESVYLPIMGSWESLSTPLKTYVLNIKEGMMRVVGGVDEKGLYGSAQLCFDGRLVCLHKKLSFVFSS